MEHEALYARHGNDHTALTDRHVAEHDKGADAALTQKAVLSAGHAAQHVWMEVRHAPSLHGWKLATPVAGSAWTGATPWSS